MCVFECLMPPSMSVTREQEVWGEYGIYTAHKHKSFSKSSTKDISRYVCGLPSFRRAHFHRHRIDDTLSASQYVKTHGSGSGVHTCSLTDASDDNCFRRWPPSLALSRSRMIPRRRCWARTGSRATRATCTALNTCTLPPTGRLPGSCTVVDRT